MRLPFVAGGFDLSKYEAAGKPGKRFAQEPSERHPTHVEGRLWYESEVWLLHRYPDPGNFVQAFF
jgi:hypothetical protein